MIILEALKELLIYQKVHSNFVASGLKKLFIFMEELSKLENQTRSYFLELLPYYYINYSLAIRVLTTHPIIGI